MRTGLTLGKFLPFHQGHELLIQTASACVDRLIVLIGVSEDDPYTAAEREDWVFHAHDEGWSNSKLVVFEQPELDRNAPKDADGTITDENYWNAWLTDTRELLGNLADEITHVFTSDQYGQRIAKEFGAEWYPVDPDREIIPVSGTKVRQDAVSNFFLLPSYVKETLVKTVAVVGPESTGKSQLVKHLGEKFNCPWVPEYGRTVCKPRDSKLTLQDFKVILDGQEAFVANAVSRANVPLVISDTEALVTSLFYEMYYPEKKTSIFTNRALEQNFDLYLVLAPSVPMVQDGTRLTTEMQRWQFYYSLLEKLREMKKPFEMIEHSDFTYRTAKAEEHVARLIGNV